MRPLTTQSPTKLVVAGSVSTVPKSAKKGVRTPLPRACSTSTDKASIVLSVRKFPSTSTKAPTAIAPMFGLMMVELVT